MKTILLLGSGELGKEFAIAAQRLGQTVVACDKYAGAPAMQVADAAEVFAICSRDIMPSCIRAPPEVENTMTGSFFFVAYSKARVTFSPTAMPMLPIMNRLSITTNTVRRP